MEIKAASVHLSNYVVVKENKMKSLKEILNREVQEKETQGRAITSLSKQIVVLKKNCHP